MRSAIRRVASAALDALCPERCAACGVVVATHDLFCHACRDAGHVLGPPECARCRRPLAGGGACARCVLEDGAARQRAIRLVDDVWTSGPTAHAAVAALRRDGARVVDVLTFARVADPRYETGT